MCRPLIATIWVGLMLLVGVLSFGPVQSGRTEESSPVASPAAPPTPPIGQRCLRDPEPEATPVAEGVIHEFAASQPYRFQGQAVELHAIHVVFAPRGTWAGCFTFQTVIEVEHGNFSLNVSADDCGYVSILKSDGTSGSTGDPCGIPADMDVPIEAGDTVFLDRSRVTITNAGETPGALLVAALADDDAGCGSFPCP